MNYLVEILGIYGLVIGLMTMMQGGILNIWGVWISSLPEPLGKPLGLCVQCFGTWLFIVFYFIDLDLLWQLGLFYFFVDFFKDEKPKIR